MGVKQIKAQQRIAELERKLSEALAGQAHVYHFADTALSKAGAENLMASGVVLTLTALGGREIIPPALIRNGLSAESIAALRADIVRSYDLAVRFQPKRPAAKPATR